MPAYTPCSADDIPAARNHLEQAAQAARAIREESPAVAVNLGWVRREEGDLDGARSMFEASLQMSRRSGEQTAIGQASLGLACLAADLGDWHRAATLHGVAQAFIDRSGEPWQDLEARYRQDSLGQVRAHLGDERFDQAYAKGLALGLDEALDLALGRVRASAGLTLWAAAPAYAPAADRPRHPGSRFIRFSRPRVL